MFNGIVAGLGKTQFLERYGHAVNLQWDENWKLFSTYKNA